MENELNNKIEFENPLNQRRKSKKSSLISPFPIDEDTEPTIDNLIKIILSKEPKIRTDEEIEYLCKSLSNLQFFHSILNKYGRETLKDIFYRVTFREEHAKKFIIKIGEVADRCYILLDGKCEALLPEVIHTGRGGSTFDLCRVGLISSGTLFGDKGFINRLRTANVRTITNCFFLELMKSDFLEIFENSFKIELNSKINFYKSMKLFEQCDRAQVEKFTYYMSVRNCRNEEYVVKQGDELKNIFIIKKGLFEVSYKTENTLKIDFNINYFSQINSERFSERRLHEITGYKNISDYNKVIVLGPGEIFGDMEFYKRKENYLFSLKCLRNNSEILFCEVDKFLFGIGNILEKKLKKITKDKIATLRNRLEQINISHQVLNKTKEKKFKLEILEKVCKNIYWGANENENENEIKNKKNNSKTIEENQPGPNKRIRFSNYLSHNLKPAYSYTHKRSLSAANILNLAKKKFPFVKENNSRKKDAMIVHKSNRISNGSNSQIKNSFVFSKESKRFLDLNPIDSSFPNLGMKEIKIKDNKTNFVNIHKILNLKSTSKMCFNKNIHNSIFDENNKSKFFKCAEMRKKNFINKSHIDSVLKEKYNKIRKNCSNFNLNISKL